MDKKDIPHGLAGGKEKWSSQVESTLSLIGYAVGLGNFWRFPYLCMQKGGGAFLVPYMTWMIICGLPLFYLELSISQFSGLGPLAVWEICPLLKGVGWGMIMVSTICSIYFIVIIVWAVYYLGMSLRRDVPWRTCNNTWNTPACIELGNPGNHSLVNESVSHFIGDGTGTDATLNSTSPTRDVSAAEEFWSHKVLGISDGIDHIGYVKWDLAVCLMVTWLLVWLCRCKGIKSSGKAVYVTVPLPYIILTILLIRGVTLPGSLDGIKYYIIPDWSKLNNFAVWTEACIQVFYTLGPTWGGLHVFASYNRFHNNCLRDSLIVTLTCAGTSIYAGFAIFAILGYMSQQTGIPIEEVVQQGPGLAFVAYPEALTMLPVSPFWSVCLFLGVISLGIDGEFGMLETAITGLIDEYPDLLSKRKTIFGVVVCVALFLLGLPIITQGGMYLFQVIDWYLAVISPFIFGFLECVVIGFVYGIGRFYDDMTLMYRSRPSYFWAVCWCGIIPVLLLFMLVMNCMWFVPPTYGSYTYPDWAVALGWMVAITPTLAIPTVAIYQLVKAEGSFTHRLVTLTRASPRWRPQSMDVDLDAYDTDRSESSTWSERMRWKKTSYYKDNKNVTATEEIALNDNKIKL